MVYQQQNSNRYNQQQTNQGYQEDFSQDNNEMSTYDQEEKEMLKLQLDVKDLLTDFEHVVLRGEFEHIDEKSGKKIWKQIAPDSPRIINDIGIRELIGRIFGFVNKATKLSWFSEEEIYKDMFYFDVSMSELIAKRSGEWELNLETAKSIKDSALELVKSILFSARNGFTAINLRSQYQKSDITRTDSQSKQNRSFLGIPLSGK